MHTKIILLDTIPYLGKLGDHVLVKSGYARNFLFPYKKAILASKKNIELISNQLHSLQLKQHNYTNERKKIYNQIIQLNSITIPVKTGHQGKLFGSINARNIASELLKNEINIYKNMIKIPSGKIRTIGMYIVKINISEELKTNLIVNIISNTP